MEHEQFSDSKTQAGMFTGLFRKVYIALLSPKHKMKKILKRKYM